MGDDYRIALRDDGGFTPVARRVDTRDVLAALDATPKEST